MLAVVGGKTGSGKGRDGLRADGEAKSSGRVCVLALAGGQADFATNGSGSCPRGAFLLNSSRIPAGDGRGTYTKRERSGLHT